MPPDLADPSPPHPSLAPPPDFRYVGLETARSRGLAAWMGILGAGAAVGAAVHGSVGALVGVGVSAAAGAVLGAEGASGLLARDRDRVAMAIVPWGIAVEWGDRSRVLRWPAVVRVHVRGVHGRDQGTSITRYSVVTVETPHERFVGRVAGTPPLERLAAHLADYSREACHRIALDLDGSVSGEGPSEPDAELVLAAARGYLATSAAAGRLDLSAGGYRKTGGGAVTPRTVAELASVLHDRTAREVDPRPFAAVLAVELGAVAVRDALVELVQAPLPLLAAIAKVAATKLGVAKARVGTLEEVEPFLLRPDAEALAAWQAA